MDYNNRNFPWNQIQLIKFTKDFSQGEKIPELCPGSSGYRVKVPKCGRWRQAHSQRQGLNREVPTEGSPRQTIDLTNRNGLRHMLSGKTARQVEAQRPHGDGSVKTEGT